MAQKRNTWTRLTAIAVALFGLYLADSGRASAAVLPECDGFCNESADCDAACLEWNGEGWDATICGNFNGGWLGGQCDGDSCYHLCDVLICEATCYAGGEPSYCGAITHEC